MNNSADRRVTRTKTALREALLTLIQERGYDAITTQEIVDRANVGRSTFYAHYADKEDLLLENMQQLADYLRARTSVTQSAEEKTPLSFALPMLEHMAEVREMFVSILGATGSRVVQQMFHDTLCTLISEALPPDGVSDTVPQTVLIEFLASGFMATAKWWVVSSPDKSVTEIHQVFQALVAPTCSRLIE